MGNKALLDENATLPQARPFLDLFLGKYMDAALFASIDDRYHEGEPMDRYYKTTDFAPETFTAMESDCLLFFTLGALEDFSTDEIRKAGVDFWLTRNGHGAGFWDGDWTEPNASRLTTLAHSFTECALYVGEDDRLIYLTTHGRKEDANHATELTDN